MGIDYYGVLGLSKFCHDLDIKQAFRKLAIQYNPQRQKNPEFFEVFSLVCEAYDVLSQPKHRAVYDQYGEEGLKKGIPTLDAWIPPYVYHGDSIKTYKEFFGTSSPYADLMDLVLRMPETPLFSFQEGRGIKKKEPPFFRPLALTLFELYHGTIKKMKIQHRVFVDDTEMSTSIVHKILTIPIKPGLPPGTEISFPECGDQGHTIIPGDIIFVTEDRPHDTYHRHGVNLKTTIHLNLQEALTGTTLELETLDFRKLRIPITQVITPDYIKVVEGEGMPFVDDPRQHGDLIISFSITFPVYLPKSSKFMVKKAMTDAKRGGVDGMADRIQQIVLKDHDFRITET